MSDDDKHLWEIEHPYYCNEVNYFSLDTVQKYESWEAFVEEEGDSDFDMNLVFRWDWKPKNRDLDEESPKWHEDPHHRDGELWIFWMGQRKGLFRSSMVHVCFADEPEVRKWLQERWEHMKSLWEPFA